MLKAGIVGLPNVGKSTLFNALTASYQAESANYPFCTIEPNVGIVKVPDPRLNVLQQLASSQQIIPAVFEFTDIAGLVRGASKGEGLGNQFLANIREVDLVVQVVRCFEDSNIVHVDGHVDPLRDIDTIWLEFCLADATSIQKRMERLAKQVKTKDPVAMANYAFLEKLKPFVDAAEPIDRRVFTEDELVLLAQSQLLAPKPVLYCANVPEHELGDPSGNVHYQRLLARAQAEGRPVVAISAQIEAELSQLEGDERQEYLTSLGIASSGVDNLIKTTFDALGLKTYFTAGEKEVRAWPFPEGFLAPQCAGIIHTDFEKGFIRAEVIGYADYVTCQGEKIAKEKGLMRAEGKTYLMHDGDVVHFRFNK
jgi:ribosome-binding ATPase